ncbi:MAG: Lrp/AsnC ligand binding domain-containing protein, partial [Bacteroidota bacterium]
FETQGPKHLPRNLVNEHFRAEGGFFRGVGVGEKLGLGIKAFIQVSLLRQRENAINRFVEHIEQIDEIVECEQVAGDFDYQLKAMTSDIESFNGLIKEKLSKIEEIGHMKSYIILSTVKSSRTAPVPHPDEH